MANSPRTRGGASYEDICSGEERYYTFRLIDLVDDDGVTPLSFQASKTKLVTHVDRIFADIRRQQNDKELETFVFGKTKTKPLQNQTFNRTLERTWWKNEINTVWQNLKKVKRNYDGLVVLTAITDNIISPDIRAIMIHMSSELYAVELSQALMHHYEQDNSQLELGGISDAYAGVVFVAFKLKEKVVDGQTTKTASAANVSQEDIKEEKPGLTTTSDNATQDGIKDLTKEISQLKVNDAKK